MQIMSKAGLLAGAILLFAGSANAAITVFDTQAAFFAATTGAQDDTFSDLDINLYDSPLTRNAGSYSYQVSAANGLFPGGADDRFMSTNTATDALVFSNFSNSPSAIGGLFFGSDRQGEFAPGVQITLVVTDSSGSVTEILVNPARDTFRGFTSTGTITSLTVSALNDDDDGVFFWPSVDNLTLATAAAIPEPATWAMMIGGFGMIGGTLRRRRVSVSYA